MGLEIGRKTSSTPVLAFRNQLIAAVTLKPRSRVRIMEAAVPVCVELRQDLLQRFSVGSDLVAQISGVHGALPLIVISLS